MEEFKKDLDDYFCRFTFGQFVTLILLEIVTLFFVFYLGARYGADLLGTGQARQEAVIPSQSPNSVDEIVGNPQVEYTYPEVLTSREGQKAIRIKPSGVSADEYERQKAENPAAIIERDTPKPEAPGVREEPIEEMPVAPQTPPKAANPPVSATPQEEVLPDTKVESPVEEAPATAKPKGKFTIQVGSYQSSQEATASVSNWKKKGYSAFMAVAAIPNKGTWYRVRIGGFPSREDAQKFLDKFKAKEKASALVVLSSS